MRKSLIIVIATILIGLAAPEWHLAIASPDSLEFKNFTEENEKNMDKLYLREYEPAEIFSDRINEQGLPIPAKDFIRPDETAALVKIIVPGDLNLEGKIEKIYSFVRENFQFLPDEEGQDYWQMPGETILRQKGDCEDLAFLLASMLIEAGIPEELIRVNVKNWHAYTSVMKPEGNILVLETDPNPDHFYLYDWPQYWWNRQVIEKRKRR